MIGTTDREGTLFARTGLTSVPTTRARLDRMFALADPPARDRVLAAYAGRGARPCDVAGDHAFWWPAVGVAEGHAAVAPTFVYRYDLAPRLLRLAGLDATHAAEMHPGVRRGRLADGAPADGRRRPRRAARGELADAGALGALRAARRARPGWPAYDADHRPTLVFDETDRVEDNPRAERRAAWSGFTDYR